MRLIITFIAGVLPALAAGCASIVGITNIASNLIPRDTSFHAPNCAQSSLLLVWLLAALVGSLACTVAWLKDFKQNSEPNKWLIGGLFSWIFACLPFATIGVLELRGALFVSWLELLVVTSGFSSVLVAIFFLNREIKLSRRAS